MEISIGNRSSKNIYISVMNVIAAFSVVVLHANVSFWLDCPMPFWSTANVIESVFYFAVPVFFMLSGATLIDYQDRYSTKEFFKKRFLKTVVPFIFWSVFGMLWAYRETLWAILLNKPNNGLDGRFLSITDGIVNTRFRDIYWFFIPLFCIYMIIPLFASVKKEKRIKIFTYLIGISFVINFIVPFGLSLLNRYAEINFEWTYKIYVGFEYLFYVLVGYVIHKTDIKLKHRLIIYVVAIAGLLTHIIGTYYATLNSGRVSVDQFFKGYYNLPCAVYSIGIYLFIKQASAKIKNKKAVDFFSCMQGYTFPIYLIHRYYLDIFEKHSDVLNLYRDSLIYVFSTTIMALILSVLTTMILRKIPILKRIVP